MELAGIGVGGFQDKVRAVAFRFLPAYPGDGVRTLFFRNFLRFRLAVTESGFNGLLPFIAPFLYLFKVTGKVILRGVTVF